jgi:hypothetical protein
MPDTAPAGAPPGPAHAGADGEQTAAPAATASESGAAGIPDAPEFSPVTVDDLPVIETIKPATRTERWDPEQHRAFTQSRVTFTLIWVLIAVLILGAALLSTTRWTGITAQDVSDFFGVAFAAVVTLVTAATSFWFGTEHGRREQNRK